MPRARPSSRAFSVAPRAQAGRPTDRAVAAILLAGHSPDMATCRARCEFLAADAKDLDRDIEEEVP